MFLTKIITEKKNKMLSIPYEIHRTLYNNYHTDNRLLFRVEGNAVYISTPDQPIGDLPYNCSCKWVENYASLIRIGIPQEFRLSLNPTFRNNCSRKVLPIYDQASKLNWINRKFEKSGAKVMDIIIKQIIHNKERQPDKWAMPLYKIDTVLLLSIIDMDKFISFAQHGIGRSKAFGCGLLVPNWL